MELSGRVGVRERLCPEGGEHGAAPQGSRHSPELLGLVVLSTLRHKAGVWVLFSEARGWIS